MAAQSGAAERGTYYPALDGLRACALMMVFCGHYLQLPWGWTGVDVFFVLSGFLITGILHDTRDDAHRIRNFYVRRTLRIFPLYYALMLLLVMTVPLLHWRLNTDWLAWPAYFGNAMRFVRPYVQGSPLQQLADFQPHGTWHGNDVVLFLGHFWSLCVEEQFYLLWPWAVYWLRDRRKLMMVCALALPICLAARVTGQHLLPQWMLANEILYRATPFRLDALLLGGLLALILRGPDKDALLVRARRLAPYVFVTAFVIFLFTPGHYFTQNPYVYPDWKFTFGLTGVDILAATVLLLAIQPQTLTYRLLSNKALRWLGGISYGCYVFHDIFHPQIQEIVWNLLDGGVAVLMTAVLGFVVMVGLAWLSYRFFESPFLRLKDRWTVRAA